MAKGIERGVARALRAEHGTPVKILAALLGASPSSISLWVRDIEISDEQRVRNLARGGRARSEAWSRLNRERRLDWQREGRIRARQSDPLHQAGCMLYWAEGSKGRNTLVFANSDPAMVVYFRRFLAEIFGLGDDRFTMRLNVYLPKGETVEPIEAHWLDLLDLPRSCLRKHTLTTFRRPRAGTRKVVCLTACAR